MDHIGVKIFARSGSRVDWASLIPVFHRWIQEGTMAEILPVDVADYSHVPMGPGVLLIGHHATVSVDNRENRLGVLYLRKTVLEGSVADKLRHSCQGAVRAARQLEREADLRGLVFDETSLEMFVNDRLLAPNIPGTWASLRRDLERVFPDSHLEWKEAARDLFRVKIALATSSSPVSLVP